MTSGLQARRVAPTLTDDARKVIAGDAGWQMRVAARRLAVHLDDAISAHGLSSAQFTLMCLIASAPDDTIGGLAARAGLDQSTLSRTVEGLVRAGLAEVVTAEKDRRRRAVWLTEAGARRLAAAMPDWRAAHAALGPAAEGCTRLLQAMPDPPAGD
ncbi:MarR family winged helix-turn-helix transcriptional regulator [Marinibaculum pumilum]|uniref:MarR family winged helix-turn-helix transcriptional regulator n=1 Tax=Marinibaculum pumilum TaxID=1766165 RepID=A0ABV7L0R8_9PROT